MTDTTLLLTGIDRGEPQAAERLLVLVYEELRSLASRRMARERAPHTLQPTALVHEAWMRLIAARNPQFENRAHFFCAAAEAMRRILIDRARRRLAARHGGGQETVEFDDALVETSQPDDQLVAVHESLAKLAEHYPVHAEVVKLRYFAGFTIEQTAELLGISPATAKNYWTFSRTWLFKAITKA